MMLWRALRLFRFGQSWGETRRALLHALAAEIHAAAAIDPARAVFPSKCVLRT